jgi:hypothetical protein
VREIAMRVKRDDAFNFFRRRKIERTDARMRLFHPEEIDEQLILRERHVIDVDRLTGDVTGSGIVRDVASDGAHR